MPLRMYNFIGRSPPARRACIKVCLKSIPYRTKSANPKAMHYGAPLGINS